MEGMGECELDRFGFLLHGLREDFLAMGEGVLFHGGHAVFVWPKIEVKVIVVPGEQLPTNGGFDGRVTI